MNKSKIIKMNEDLDRAVEDRDQAYYDYQNEFDE